MSWTSVIGRVAFTNCEPLFHGLSDNWTVLPAPPAWLTGHVLRRDCITAPIPTADYALHHKELMLLPELGIVGMGAVGSVILFGTRELDKMRDIALPSDSSTSRPHHFNANNNVCLYLNTLVAIFFRPSAPW